MNLLQIVSVASIADPEGAKRALELVQEAYIRSLAKEAGLSQIVVNLALTKLRKEEEVRLRGEAEITR
ncbi:MAG: hypothetical protein AAB887_01570 [Patescibacteria group bacterium]